MSLYLASFTTPMTSCITRLVPGASSVPTIRPTALDPPEEPARGGLTQNHLPRARFRVGFREIASGHQRHPHSPEVSR